MRLVRLLIAVILPLALVTPAIAAVSTPPPVVMVPPAGTMVAAFGVSDGTVLLPLGVTHIINAVCTVAP